MRYRPSVRAILLAEDHVLLMAMKFPWRENWQWITPGGGIEADESPLQALRRELFEETGLRLDHVPPQIGSGEEPYPDAGITLQHRYFLIPTLRFTPIATAMEQREQDWFQRFCWWPLGELENIDLLPANLNQGIQHVQTEPEIPFVFR